MNDTIENIEVKALVAIFSEEDRLGEEIQESLYLLEDGSLRIYQEETSWEPGGWGPEESKSLQEYLDDGFIITELGNRLWENLS